MRFLLTLPILLGLTTAARAQDLSPRVEAMLSYLPPQSENLSVDQKSRLIPVKADENPDDEDEAGEFILPANLQIGVVAPALAGRTIELSMEARSNFRAPKGPGVMPYDGSGIALLKPLAGQSRDDLKKLAWKNSKQKLTLVGQEVGLFEQKGDLDSWRIYVAVPRPDMIVTATDRASMITTLARMQRTNLSDRAIPTSWSGWKLVDTTAPFWAVRRLDASKSTGNSYSNPFGKDSKARSLVVYNRIEADGKSDWVIKYEGDQKFALKLFVKIRREVKGMIIQPKPAQLTLFTVSSPDGYFLYYALGLLGPAIYI